MRLWLPAILVLLALQAHAGEEVIRLTVEVGESTVSRPAASQQYWNRLHLMELPGQPLREVYPLLVLLPPDLSGRPTVRVESFDCVAVTDLGRPSGRALRSLMDGKELPVVHGSFAGRYHAGRPVQEGDARMLPLLIFPENDGRRCSHFDIAVKIERSGESPPAAGHFLPRRVARRVANPEGFALWYVSEKRDAAAHDFLIVARQPYMEQSVQLGPFMEFKAAQGFNPMLTSLEAIEEEMAPEALARPEALRGWLQKHYKEEGFKYLLLIGDPDPASEGGIPMKQCWPSKDFEDPSYGMFDVPTDLYYGDLTGNWNPDGDELWCELEDYMELPEDWPPEDPEGDRLDGMDLVPELLVGRIPHFGKLPYYADGILARIMLYGAQPPEQWHNQVLLGSPMIAFPDGGYVDGSMVSQYVIEQSLDKNGHAHTMLSERLGKLVSYHPGEDQLNGATMSDYYNQGFGMVFWCAHGNQLCAVLNTWYDDYNQDGLPQQEECLSDPFINDYFHKAADDTFPAVFFQGSCLTADPSEHGNMTHTLLQHVSIANVASTRITMGMDAEDGTWEPSPYSPGAFTLGVYFTHAAVAKRMPVGDAFHYAQNTLGFGIQPWTLKVRLEFNLYGDPSMRLPGCDDDLDCSDGNYCNGIEFCKDGKCQSAPAPDCTVEESPGQCRKADCVPETGCTLLDLEEGTPCEDGDPCMVGENCKAGECVGASPVQCPPPPSGCWQSVCTPESGECMFEPANNGMACQDGETAGACADGKCVVEPVFAVDEGPGPDVAAAQPDPGPEPPPPEPSSGCGAAPGHASPIALLLLLLVVTLFLRSRRLRRS
jgi:hypothetical protein